MKTRASPAPPNRPGHCANGASTSIPVSSPKISGLNRRRRRRRDQHQGPRRRHYGDLPRRIAETSIRSYLSAPGFVIENGTARRRTEVDGWPAVPPLNTARGAFHNGPNEIRIALPVTFDVLRGSGQTLNPAIATALGINPGQQRSFTGALPSSPSSGGSRQPTAPASAPYAGRPRLSAPNSMTPSCWHSTCATTPLT